MKIIVKTRKIGKEFEVLEEIYIRDLSTLKIQKTMDTLIVQYDGTYRTYINHAVQLSFEQ